MNDTQKLSQIDQYRRDFERTLQAMFGVEATVTVALHLGTAQQTQAGIDLGWRSYKLEHGTISTSSPSTNGIGSTVVYYHSSRTTPNGEPDHGQPSGASFGAGPAAGAPKS